MAEESEVTSLKSGTSGSGALLILRIHVRFRRNQGSNNRQMAFEACTVQRNASSVEINWSLAELHEARKMDVLLKEIIHGVATNKA